MYKYLWFIVIGILIFILINNKNSFSVGMPECSSNVGNTPINFVTKNLLSSFGYIFNVPIQQQANFRLYDVDGISVEIPNIEYLQNMYRTSGNSQPSYALQNVDNVIVNKLFYLTIENNGKEYIVSRAFIIYNYVGFNCLLANFTTVPYDRGKGYGSKLMELLSITRKTNILYRIHIDFFEPSRGTEKAYRNQFRLSVKPETEGGWPKIPGEKFAIYKPTTILPAEIFDEMTDDTKYTSYMMNAIYFGEHHGYVGLNSYDKLYYMLFPNEQTPETYNSENKSKYNHFLMQLTEDEVTDLLSDIDKNIAIIDDHYRDFLISNYP
jgi:hypothetical protein